MMVSGVKEYDFEVGSIQKLISLIEYCFSKHISSLYDLYPELETEAKIYFESETKKKNFQLFQTL
ncbi:hypothetical protein BpHYR1_037362 [Brachionus plicatilis]|uniref:Uncharacterized protein n=1 Tax=Brachionus plicatilis TaxID=10195 RepID=A0A3M7SU94_BRAPC|nr:hypothetical protein BpHYR1_037362 [Brachionus plicatilis]